MTLRGLAGAMLRSGAVPLLVSIIAVQGFSALAQLVVARMLEPADFGVVRSVEAVLSMMLLVASAGMPSLAIRDIAAARAEDRPSLITRLLLLALITAILVATGAFVGVRFLVPPAARSYFAVLIWTIALTSCSRTALNYYQGVGRIPVIARISLGSSVGAFILLTILVNRLGMRGWLLGRYAGELLMLVATLTTLRGSASLRNWKIPNRALLQLWSRGMVISAGLMVRTAQDGFITLLLAWRGAVRDVGYFGLAALTLTPLLLLPSIIASLAIPRLVRLRGDPGASSRELKRLVSWSAAASVAAAAVALMLLPAVILQLFPSYRPALGIVAILIIGIPLRSVSMLPGAFLMAVDRNGVAISVNLVGLVIAVTCSAVLIPLLGARGAAWGMLLGDLCSCVMFVATAGVLLRRERSQACGHTEGA